MMADSGARGSKDQMRQLAGMRGLMASHQGNHPTRLRQLPRRPHRAAILYFHHGARKGLADTALKTANSGYLTRRLVDVSQDVIISEPDCGTMDGIQVEALREAGEIIQRLGERILGRITHEDIVDPVTGEVLLTAELKLTNRPCNGSRKRASNAPPFARLDLSQSAGICAMCYGRDLAQGKLAQIGEAIGIIAAQSIANRAPSSPCVLSTSVGRPVRASKEPPSTTAIRSRAFSELEHRAAIAKGPGGDEPQRRTQYYK